MTKKVKRITGSSSPTPPKKNASRRHKAKRTLESATREAKQMTAKPLVPRVKTLAGTPIPAKRNYSVVIRDGIAQIVGQSINVGGFDLPPDQEEAFAECVGMRMASENFPVQGLSAETAEKLRYQIQGAMRQGFYLAVLHYAEDLKQVPEAAAILEALRKNSKKATKAREKQSGTLRQEARRLDRELRKTVKKKYLRVERIAAEMKVATRTVERYLAPKK